MKKFKFSGLFILLLCVFSNQVAFSAIIIRKDDPGTGTAGTSTITKARTVLTTTSFASNIPVLADIVDDELIVDFTSSVGTAYVSVVDHSGNVIYQTVIDTLSSSEVVIPVDDLSNGKYSVKISYGITKLTGDFQL